MNTAHLKKACGFCIYQERTQDEVRKRLATWKIFGDEAEQIIVWLIEENFINEERFAKAFAGGKFRVKNWGKNKIIYELKARKMSAYCIKSGLAEIDEKEYLFKIQELISKKSEILNTETNLLVKKQKICNYLITKGFEPQLVWDLVAKSY